MKKILGTLVIAAAVIFTALILGNAYRSRAQTNESVSVVGLGEENFVSDLIVWRASFSRRSFDLREAYHGLDADREKIREYLMSKGIAEKDIIFLAVDIQKDYTYEYDEASRRSNTIFNGYVLSQQLKVESPEVNKVEEISREVTELINSGVELTSMAPEYYYTKLAALKLKMIEAATKDAKARARRIVENAGGSLGKLKYADMGVFQITGQNSSEEYSWGGSFNTASKKKTASITVHLRYSIE